MLKLYLMLLLYLGCILINFSCLVWDTIYMRCLPWFIYEETTNIYVKVSRRGFSIVTTSQQLLK